VFEGRVEGSLWVPELNTGVYVLQSCPPGYATGIHACNICPSANYCPGGTSMPIQCPSDMFSLAGSNSSASCFKVVFVSLVVSMILSAAQLLDKQVAFIEAVASSTRTRINLVQIHGIVSTQILNQISTQIMCSLACPDVQQAQATVLYFSKSSLDVELNARGILAAESASINIENMIISNSDNFLE